MPITQKSCASRTAWATRVRSSRDPEKALDGATERRTPTASATRLLPDMEIPAQRSILRIVSSRRSARSGMASGVSCLLFAAVVRGCSLPVGDRGVGRAVSDGLEVVGHLATFRQAGRFRFRATYRSIYVERRRARVRGQALGCDTATQRGGYTHRIGGLMRTVETHEARRRPSRLVQEEADGDPFVITRNGRRLVEVVSIENAGACGSSPDRFCGRRNLRPRGLRSNGVGGDRLPVRRTVASVTVCFSRR